MVVVIGVVVVLSSVIGRGVVLMALLLFAALVLVVARRRCGVDGLPSTPGSLLLRMGRGGGVLKNGPIKGYGVRGGWDHPSASHVLFWSRNSGAPERAIKAAFFSAQKSKGAETRSDRGALLSARKFSSRAMCSSAPSGRGRVAW